MLFGVTSEQNFLAVRFFALRRYIEAFACEVIAQKLPLAGMTTPMDCVGTFDNELIDKLHHEVANALAKSPIARGCELSHIPDNSTGRHEFRIRQ